MLRLDVLGGLSVFLEGRPVIEPQTPRLKAKALLAYLFLRRGQYVSREELLAALWPEVDFPRPGRLKQTVLVLRDLIEPGRAACTDHGYVLQRGGMYYFNTLADYTSDLEEFERELALARETREPRHYLRAIQLRQGELLPELRYENWLVADAARHRERYLNALDDAARLFAERGEARLAIEVLNRAVHEDPLRESSCLELMRLLASQGRAADALYVYEHLQRRLSVRLGVPPNAELTALYGAIRRK